MTTGSLTSLPPLAAGRTATPAAARRLRGRIATVASLGQHEREAMWAVFAAHYDDIDRSRFERDLDGKSHVILLRDRRDGLIKGFATLCRQLSVVDGRPVASVFAGDTILDPAYWGQTALQLAFFRYLVASKLRHPAVPLYWLLTSKGYKTYLLLTRNFPEHWPRHDRETPPWPAAVLRQLCSERFPETFEPESGLLRHRVPEGKLRPEVTPIDDRALGEPDIRFFVARNPGHAAGDELCCIGRADLRMLLAYLGKTARRLPRRLAGRRGHG